MINERILKDLRRAMATLETIPSDEPEQVILIGPMPEPLESDLKKALERNDGSVTLLKFDED